MEGEGPRGIGGWLILVGIGLVIQPFRMLVAVVKTVEPIQGDAWALLATPGAPHYHPLFAPLVMFELIGNAVFMVAGVALLYYFFTRKHAFPRYAVAFILANLVFVVADIALAQVVPALRGMDSETGREIGRSVLTAAIWIPYFLRSKRVRATFVE